MADQADIPSRRRRSGLRPVADWLDDVRRQEVQGDFLRAYDLAVRGLRQHPSDVRLKHRAVVCLAATGAIQRAWDTYRGLGLDAVLEGVTGMPPDTLGIDLETLPAHLLKEEALAIAEGPERQAKLRRAAEIYEGNFERFRNAAHPDACAAAVRGATVLLLAGDRANAARLAALALAALAERSAAARRPVDLEHEIEAYLVLGDAGRAADVAARARSPPGASEERALAATVRHFRLIAEAQALDLPWLAAFGPAKVIHYLGHIIARPGQPGRFPADREGVIAERIAAKFDQDDIGHAFGSLAAGADILFAEAALARGKSLHVVLPFRQADYVERSVRPSGGKWVSRFRRCLKNATSVTFATEDAYLGDDALFTYGNQLAMGRALLRARMLATSVEQVVVWDGRTSTAPAGTARDIQNWSYAKQPRTVIQCEGGQPLSGLGKPPMPGSGRRTRAILFGDFHSFGKLTDVQLPVFVNEVLGTVASVIGGYGDDVLIANTWGDGLYLVFDDAGKAADCALAIQDAVAGLDLARLNLPPDLGLRIGAHLGPVYGGVDPVVGRENFFGRHVTRAARIEPITPEGSIYITEPMAAVLALHNGDAFALHYVGVTRAAKRFGSMPLFLLRRAEGPPEQIRTGVEPHGTSPQGTSPDRPAVA